MIEVQRTIAMRLPDGSLIKIETYSGDYIDGNNQNHTWMSLDISRVWHDQKDKLLASIEFDEAKGLRTLVFDQTQEDPIYIKEEK